MCWKNKVIPELLRLCFWLHQSYQALVLTEEFTGTRILANNSQNYVKTRLSTSSTWPTFEICQLMAAFLRLCKQRKAARAEYGPSLRAWNQHSHTVEADIQQEHPLQMSRRSAIWASSKCVEFSLRTLAARTVRISVFFSAAAGRKERPFHIWGGVAHYALFLTL